MSASTDLKYLDWCEAGAEIFAKCSRRQYMAIVVSSEGRVVGCGYNGAPPQQTECVDGGCPRASLNVAHGSGYGNCVAVHAEMNALMWSDRTARLGGTIYVNGPPCWDCAKAIASSGVSRVVCLSDPAYADWSKCRDILFGSGISVIEVPQTI